MILAAVILSLGLPTQNVSLKFPVGPTTAAVTALGKKVGIPMAATGAAGTEVVFLDVKDMPLENVMATLARVTCADWSRVNGTYTLSRSAARRNAEFERDYSQRYRVLESYRNRLVRALDSPFSLSGLKAKISERDACEKKRTDKGIAEAESAKLFYRILALQQIHPYFRALARSMKGLDLHPLSRLGYGETCVYALHPNRAQKALPPAASDVIPALVKESSVWRKVRGRAAVEDDAWLDGFYMSYPGQEHSPETALLSITYWGRCAYSITLTFTGQHGYEGELRADDFDSWRHLGEPKERVESLPTVQPSSETQILQYRYKIEGAEALRANNKLAKYFNDPALNDPLRFGNQEVLTELAESRKKSVIACLPDNVGIPLWYRPELSGFLYRDYVKWTETGQTIELGPANFVTHWGDRVSRRAVADCVKSFRKHGRIDLLTLVKLKASCENGDGGLACEDFVRLIDPNYSRRDRYHWEPTHPAFASLLASLNSSQLKRLAKGETIPYSELSASQGKIAAKIVFGSNVNQENEWKDGYPHQPNTTLELPNGLLQGAGIRVRFGSDQIAVLHNERAPPDDEYYRADLTDPPNQKTWMGPPPDFPNGGIASSTVDIRNMHQIKVYCGVAPGRWITGKFLEMIGPQTSKAVPVKQLSPATLELLRKAFPFDLDTGTR